MGQEKGVLALMMALDIECESCGRIRRFQRRKIMELELKGYRTVEQIGHRLVCRHCCERRGEGRNVSVTPRWFPGHAG